jgi:GH15 family glucan-1,4-alpha-glucosidase
MEWCCLPIFDSPSVFARILDWEKGGYWGIEGDYETYQQYMPKTNILVTRFENPDSAFELIDFMPRHKDGNRYYTPSDVVRMLRPTKGKPQITVQYHPRLRYAEDGIQTELQDGVLKSFTTDKPYESVYLYTNMDREKILNREPIELNKDRFMLLSYNQKLEKPTIHSLTLELERTKVYWMSWSAESPYLGEYHNIIERSALAMKLLAYQKTGAVLAAVTTSIPEEVGSVRNWDYRFCWLRDASMTIKVFTDLGHFNVGRRYLQFILDMLPIKDESIQIMYGINGEKTLTEKELDWLDGYKGSKPVRVGNAAYKQVQNDIYGLVMDTIYQSLLKSGGSLEQDYMEDLWTVVRSLIRYVESDWEKPDSGIWEIRGEKRHFVFSKVMCWVAVERALHIASLLGKFEYRERWVKLKDTIMQDVMENGWSDTAQAFTQSYGDDSLDAANLLMEHYGFIAADDPKNISTVQQTHKELCRDGLMFRYRNQDDFGEPTSSFTVCTFWMVKSLHRIGEKEKARSMFEQLLLYSNHLGLYSEDIHFETKELLGNFPQGYSHLALIDTALTLMED